jgi:hypothetical protein
VMRPLPRLVSSRTFGALAPPRKHRIFFPIREKNREVFGFSLVTFVVRSGFQCDPYARMHAQTPWSVFQDGTMEAIFTDIRGVSYNVPTGGS